MKRVCFVKQADGNDDDDYIPRLFALSNTRNSITLSWNAPSTKNNKIYKVQVKDRLWGWTTKYWGFKTKVEIKELRPQECFSFRLGVMELNVQSLETAITWSSTVKAITKDEPIAAVNLHTAILFGHMNLTKKFLSLRPSAIDCYDSNGKTPLMKCARLGNGNIASALIAAGASINMQSIPSRSTALMITCWFGNLQIATLLHENGANWNTKDNHGCTALHYAVDNSQVDLIRFALECGANIEEKDDNGWSPLLRGVYLMSDEAAISELINNGANVNVCDSRGQTSLMQAIITSYNNLPIIKLLISAGANIRAYNNYSNTALQMANARNDGAIVEELISSLEKLREDSDNEDDKQGENSKDSLEFLKNIDQDNKHHINIIVNL